jgi:hypothetical protein
VDGNVTFQKIKEPWLDDEITEVVEARVELKDPLAPFGQVKGGAIVLRGPLAPAAIRDERVCIVGAGSGRAFLDVRKPSIALDGGVGHAPEDHADHNSLPSEDVWCILLHSRVYSGGEGLILRKQIEDGMILFQRIGLFNDYEDQSESGK